MGIHCLPGDVILSGSTYIEPSSANDGHISGVGTQPYTRTNWSDTYTNTGSQSATFYWYAVCGTP